MPRLGRDTDVAGTEDGPTQGYRRHAAPGNGDGPLRLPPVGEDDGRMLDLARWRRPALALPVPGLDNWHVMERHTGRTREAITKRYDAWAYEPLTREYYGESEFYNFGFWGKDTRDQRQACENLMEELLRPIAEREGTILDVACGMGGTTSHLLKYWEPPGTVGIDISGKQLRTAAAKAPGCTFAAMDATRLGFRDGVFDKVICVEAAFHFERLAFLREVCRVLRPGGRLVLSDILLARWAARLSPVVPAGNAVDEVEAYKSLFAQAGFSDVTVVDATDETWRPFSRNMRRWVWGKLLAREVGPVQGVKAALPYLAVSLGVRRYVLVSARKA